MLTKKLIAPSVCGMTGMAGPVSGSTFSTSDSGSIAMVPRKSRSEASRGLPALGGKTRGD
jgi:hypothetical protein